MAGGDRMTVIPPGRPEGGWPPDPEREPERYGGVLPRRVGGYLVDLVVLALLEVVVWVIAGTATVITFGLLAPVQALIMALVPLAYHTLLIGGPHSATLGMRLAGVEVRRMDDGGRPALLQALAHTAVFYLGMALTSGLVLAVALFNRHGRTLHDFLAGTVVVRKEGVFPMS